jgi:hypothetical protein
MARAFTKNVANYGKLGVNVIGPLLNGAAKLSFHAWINGTSFTTGAYDNVVLAVVISGGNTGVWMNVGAAGHTLLIGGRSKAADSFQQRITTATLSTSTWTSIGGVLNFAAGTITPYLAGSADNSGAATFGSTTYVQGTPTGSANDAIGYDGNGSGPSATAIQVAGNLAEVSIWTDDIAANGFAALAKGVRPHRLLPGKLTCYWPLWGLASPEVELVNNKVLTFTGTVSQANHAPLTTFTRKTRTSPDSAAAIVAGRPKLPQVISPPVPVLALA